MRALITALAVLGFACAFLAAFCEIREVKRIAGVVDNYRPKRVVQTRQPVDLAGPALSYPRTVPAVPDETVDLAIDALRVATSTSWRTPVAQWLAGAAALLGVLATLVAVWA